MRYGRWIVVPACVMLLSGCALFAKPADTVSFPRGEAFVAYSDVRVTYALLKQRLEDGCKAGRLDPEFCAGLPRANEEVVRVDGKIMQALANPATVIDWAAIAEAIRLVMALAKAAL